MPDYQRLNGERTTAADPTRGCWYSGPCTFWTDDWSQLKGDIPCCPDCGSPGHQTTMADWDQSVAEFQAEGNAGYVAFIAWLKEHCHGKGVRGADVWAWHQLDTASQLK